MVSGTKSNFSLHLRLSKYFGVSNQILEKINYVNQKNHENIFGNTDRSPLLVKDLFYQRDENRFEIILKILSIFDEKDRWNIGNNNSKKLILAGDRSGYLIFGIRSENDLKVNDVIKLDYVYIKVMKKKVIELKFDNLSRIYILPFTPKVVNFLQYVFLPDNLIHSNLLQKKNVFYPSSDFFHIQGIITEINPKIVKNEKRNSINSHTWLISLSSNKFIIKIRLRQHLSIYNNCMHFLYSKVEITNCRFLIKEKKIVVTTTLFSEIKLICNKRFVSKNGMELNLLWPNDKYHGRNKYLKFLGNKWNLIQPFENTKLLPISYFQNRTKILNNFDIRTWKLSRIPINYESKPKIYYAHSMQIYGTLREEYELYLIKKKFPFSTIFNPSNYEKYWREKGYSQKQIMTKCLKIISKSDIFIFSDSKKRLLTGQGVVDEEICASKLGLKRFFIWNDGLVKYKLIKSGINDWKYCGKVILDQNNLENYSTKNTIHMKKFRSKQFHNILDRFSNIYIKQINKNLFIESFLESIFDYYYKKEQIIVFFNKNEEIIKLFNKSLLFNKATSHRDQIIVPIFGRKNFCLLNESTKDFHYDLCDNCIKKEQILQRNENDLFDVYIKSLDKFKMNSSIFTQFKNLLGIHGCPYYLLQSICNKADIILINELYLKKIRLRGIFWKKIIKFNFQDKIILLKNPYNLFGDDYEDFITKNDITGLTTINPSISNKLEKLFEDEKKVISPIKGLQKELISFYEQNKDKIDLNKSEAVKKIFNFIQTITPKWIIKQNKIFQYIPFNFSILRFLDSFKKVIVYSDSPNPEESLLFMEDILKPMILSYEEKNKTEEFL